MKNNKLPYVTARIISTIFVPPTFTVFLFVYCAFLLETDFSKRIFIIIIALIFGLFLPVFVFIRLRKGNKISDIDTSRKEQRNIPYFLNGLFCLAAIPPILLLETANFFPILWGLFFINTVLLYIINMYWKISAHLIGASISLGALGFLGNEIVYYIIPVIIIMGWARIKLGIHNLTQVVAGGILGFSLTYFTLNIIFNFITT